MLVNKKMLANYLGIHRNNVTPYYNDYLATTGKRFLLATDISVIDAVPIEYVCEQMGVTTPKSLMAKK